MQKYIYGQEGETSPLAFMHDELAALPVETWQVHSATVCLRGASSLICYLYPANYTWPGLRSTKE